MKRDKKNPLYCEVKINGFMLTPKLNVTETRTGSYKTTFVIGIPRKQVIRNYPTLKATMRKYSCVWISKQVPKFAKNVQRMDFIKILGTLDSVDFYYVENKYEHIKGMIVLCDKVKIATKEYKKFQEKTLEERYNKRLEREKENEELFF